MGTSSKSIHKALIEIAECQDGYFTAKQAVAVGYADSVHNYHVNNGDWIKAYRGIYRLSEIPEPERPELIVWSLWSRGREDCPKGSYCLETALAIHGLIKKEDGVMHMAVPLSFRKNCDIPQQLKLYKENIPPEDIEERRGFLVTTLERTCRDIRNKCTNPKILRIIETALPSRKEEEGNNVQEHHPETISFKVKEYSGWDYEWDSPVAVASRVGPQATYDEIINSGED